MLFPQKTDGSSIAVYRHMATDQVYVDAHFTADGRSASEWRMQRERGGPWKPPHHHRFEDYGLADGLLRCKKCGLVQVRS